MLIVLVSLPVSAPPVPLLLLSFTDNVSVVLAAGVSVLSLQLTVLVASVLSSALICASDPLMLAELLPLLRTVAPLVPAVTVSVPSVAAAITVVSPLTLHDALPILLFLRSRLVCSVAL